MTHPLVIQLRFARREFARCLAGVTGEEARRRFEPMNSISWIIGHMANQENAYWVRFAQGQRLLPDLRRLVGTGMPASTPPLDEMWQAWTTVTETADQFLDTITTELLTTHFELEARPLKESIGTLLNRNIYHYWYHTGEANAIRQLLGHSDVPEFVGDMSTAVYRPE